jgi:hypothetical protein
VTKRSYVMRLPEERALPAPSAEQRAEKERRLGELIERERDLAAAARARRARLREEYPGIAELRRRYGALDGGGPG